MDRDQGRDRDQLRVALLNASYNVEATRRNFGRDVDVDLRSFAANEGELPPDAGELPSENDELPPKGGYDAVIVSGSAASVYWDDAWIADLAAWVEGAIDEGIPVLGVCFGHQLVAHALGGEVRDTGEYELGYRTMERVGESVLLSGLSDRFVAFATHSDEVTTLPSGSEVIAENDYSVQGFRKGDAFGVQFHPEYDRQTAERVTQGKDLPDERIDGVLEGVTGANVAAAANVKVLFDNFLAYADRAPSPAD